MRWRAVRETNLLSIFFIFVLSLESCSTGEKICNQAVVERTQQKSGFHRDLITYIKWDILSSFGEHYNLLDCQLLLVEKFPSGVYIDPDQLKNEVEFGGPEVLFKESVNIEALAHHSSSNEMLVFPKITIDSKMDILKANITIPIHLRYHQAAKDAKFASVLLPPPQVLGRCPNGVAFPTDRCGSDPVQAPCDAKRLSTCDWIALKLRSKDQSESRMSLVLQVPIGQTEHSLPIIALTVFSTMAGCVLTLWNAIVTPF
ncbi:Phosphatidylinositol-glycan biosynthesis class X protein [Stylophora pistillata]|uniref:Phosphatidylinositol-glycan biosynthesis class X protein n=1 Tax=Stylophora pistillata TaxID=50429 RepID=A0A2B4RZM5_STYPI|nr:Phosphatidylinositol-glycan biosynthesis class X protein [Stylophora pistillata]